MDYVGLLVFVAFMFRMLALLSDQHRKDKELQSLSKTENQVN